MHRARLVPCLLLEDGVLVKTTQFSQARYVGDPVNAVRIFNDKEADELTLLDISATRIGRGPDFDLISEIADECFMPMCYGGGISDIDEIQRLFEIGVEKVSLCTAALQNPDLVREAVRQFGSQSIVGGLDVKRNLWGKYLTMTNCGQRKYSRSPVETANELVELGCGELLLNAIHVEGKMAGYDLTLVRMVADAVEVPVVACGGAGSLDDCRVVMEDGRASAAAAGSLFVYYGKHRAVLINYPREAEREASLGAGHG